MADDLVQRLRGAGAVALGRDEQATIRKAADEIERLRDEVAEQCRLNGMGGERELKWMARAEKAERELAELRERFDKAPLVRANEYPLFGYPGIVEVRSGSLPFDWKGHRVRLVRED